MATFGNGLAAILEKLKRELECLHQEALRGNDVDLPQPWTEFTRLVSPTTSGKEVSDESVPHRAQAPPIVAPEFQKVGITEVTPVSNEAALAEEPARVDSILWSRLKSKESGQQSPVPPKEDAPRLPHEVPEAVDESDDGSEAYDPVVPSQGGAQSSWTHADARLAHDRLQKLDMIGMYSDGIPQEHDWTSEYVEEQERHVSFGQNAEPKPKPRIIRASTGNGEQADLPLGLVFGEKLPTTPVNILGQASNVEPDSPDGKAKPTFREISQAAIAKKRNAVALPSGEGRLTNSSWHSLGSRNSGHHQHDLQVLEPLTIWSCPNTATLNHARGSEMSLASRAEDFTSFESWDGDDHDQDTVTSKRCRILTMQPFSKKRIFWDALSLVFITWDLTTIPLQTFDPPDSDLTICMQWVTRIFWTFDIPLSFLTGTLMPDGSVLMDPRRLARRYTRGWFLPDLIIVICDWIAAALLGVQSVVRAQRALRCSRLLRLFRFIRMVKIPETIAVIGGERIWSERILVVTGVVKIIGLVLGVSHVLACLWYGVSQLNRSNNWVNKQGWKNEDWSEIYVRSFHWSMSMFVGELLFPPASLAERIFVIIVVLFTFIVAAAVVSSITSSMTRLTFLAGKRGAQLSALRKYLLDHDISQKLMMRIQRNAEHALSKKQKRMAEGQVELIAMISEPLRVELHFEEHGPKLSHHPFFQLYTEICPAGMRKLCHEAVSVKLYYAGDVIFSVGEFPSDPQMYCVSTGSLQYQQTKATETVLPGMWVAEGVLWVRWMHRGILRARQESQLLALSAASFQDIMSCFDNQVFHPRLYALEYAENIKTLAGDGFHISDLGEFDIAKEVLDGAILRHQTERNMSLNSGHRQKSRHSGLMANPVNMQKRGTGVRNNSVFKSGQNGPVEPSTKHKELFSLDRSGSASWGLNGKVKDSSGRRGSGLGGRIGSLFSVGGASSSHAETTTQSSRLTIPMRKPTLDLIKDDANEDAP